MLTTEERAQLAADITGDLRGDFMRHAKAFSDDRLVSVIAHLAEWNIEPDDVVDDFGRELIREGRRIRRMVRSSRRAGRRA